MYKHKTKEYVCVCLCVCACVCACVCVCMCVCACVCVCMRFIGTCVLLCTWFLNSGAALLLSVVGLRVLRGSYTELSRQHMIFIFTLFFFNFDYEHYSESLPLDYFVISLIFYKVGRTGGSNMWDQIFIFLFLVLWFAAQDSFYCHLHFTLAVLEGLRGTSSVTATVDTTYPNVLIHVLGSRCTKLWWN